MAASCGGCRGDVRRWEWLRRRRPFLSFFFDSAFLNWCCGLLMILRWKIEDGGGCDDVAVMLEC
ncbi:hypothetical protein A2U01_0018645 [Trifolium medium]|uniref:Uncharacterized protein n=1 Tax=Trifolium medium TaxID=97028 RepID=A0A392NCW4_9FABA|nr:hypothetical protein [Trifolium medium]